MPDGLPPSPESALPGNITQILSRFEKAAGTGEPPDLAAFLPPEDHPDRRDVLIELAHIGLDRRLLAGQSSRVEDYLTRFPELASEPDAVVGLLLVDARLRRRRGEGVTLADYLARFPDLADYLRAHWPVAVSQ